MSDGTDRLDIIPLGGLGEIGLNMLLFRSRGQILVKMERWNEALVELQRALPQMRNNPDTHRALEKVYEAVKSPRAW